MFLSVQLPNATQVTVESVLKRNRHEKILVHISADSITLSHHEIWLTILLCTNQIIMVDSKNHV